jgi:hypothetical protein
MASVSLNTNIRQRGITEEELFVGTFRHLDSFHVPFIESHRPDKDWILEVISSKASSLKSFMILNFLSQLFFCPQSGHVVGFTLFKILVIGNLPYL